MPISLSGAEAAHLARVMAVVAAPLDHPDADSWRHAVNESLKSLLGGDSAGFLLPTERGIAMFSRDHDLDELNRYPETPVPDLADGTNIWERILTVGAGRLSDAYGADYADRYLASPYYNDYAGANGAHHPIMMSSVMKGAPGSLPVACVHVWKENAACRGFSGRDVELLKLIYPVFLAGVRTHGRWESQRADLLHTLDALGDAAMVCDSVSGRQVHRTPALERMLSSDPEAERLGDALASAVSTLRGLAAELHGGLVQASPLESLVHTQRATYGVRGCVYGRARTGSTPFVVAVLECHRPRGENAELLRDRFRFTAAEVRVARLLADGRSSSQLAEALGISPNTARRHTERVLFKVGARSRAEVGARLRER